MAIFLIFFLSALIFLYRFLRLGDVFSPWFITTAIWLLLIVVFNTTSTQLYPLKDRFYLCTMIWVPILSASAILTYYSIPGERVKGNEMHINHFWLNALFFLSIVFTPIYVYKIFKTVSMFGTENLLFNLRVLANSGEEDALGKLLKYINAINQALFIVCVWNYKQIGKVKMAIVTTACLMCAFAIMEKGALFFLGLVTVFILYEKKVIKSRTIALFGIATVMLFYGINISRVSTEQRQADDGNIFDFIAMYVLSPPVAFEQVQQKVTEQFGSRTFAFFYAFLTKLGIANYTVEPKLQEFVDVPIPTNVYTVYQPFFEDFGYKGVAFFATVYGVFTGWIYRKCQQGHSVFKCLYAYIAEILILQFFQENLILSLSLLVQYLFVFILTLQNKFKLIICRTKSTIEEKTGNTP